MPEDCSPNRDFGTIFVRDEQLKERLSWCGSPGSLEIAVIDEVPDYHNHTYDYPEPCHRRVLDHSIGADTDWIGDVECAGPHRVNENQDETWQKTIDQCKHKNGCGDTNSSIRIDLQCKCIAYGGCYRTEHQSWCCYERRVDYGCRDSSKKDGQGFYELVYGSYLVYCQ